MNRKKINTLCSLVILNKHILSFFILLLSSLSSQAQQPGDVVPLRTILLNLETQFNISFTYADETVEHISISAPPDSLDINQAIKYLKSSTPLNYHQLDDRFFTISKADDERINICGLLVDGIDRTVLAGATVQIDNRFTVSDDKGHFALSNVPANSSVYIRILGYEPSLLLARDVSIELDCDTLALNMDVTRLQEVMVHKYLTSGINKQLNGAFVVNISNLGLLPGLIEPDILQTIQAIPGIQSIDETVSHINVRGGTNDQNLVLWDGIKMYQTGHFFGLISAFNPYLSQDVTLIKNGTSAALSDGVSSIIDIRSKDDVTDKLTGGAGINMINADVFFRIPLARKLTLQLSGRRSITDLIKTPIFDNYFERAFGNTEVTQQNFAGSDTTFNSDENFYFYDIGADFLYDISNKDKLRVHFLNIFNELDYQENITTSAGSASKTSSLTQKSLAGSINYSRLWNKHLTTSAELYLSSYNLRAVNFDVLNDQRLIQENEVLDTGIKFDALWRINNRWDLFSGYQFLEVGIGNLEEINNPTFRRYIKRVIRTNVIFSEANYLSKSNKTNLRFGLRANYFTKFNRVVLEPRLTFDQKISNHWSLEILGEFKSQTASQIIDLQNDFLGVEKRRWVLADETDIPVILSKQVSTGFSFNKNGLLVSIEGFYKHVNGITSSSQGFQNQFQYVRTSGDYDVFGVEFLVNKQFDFLSFWVGYSYSDNQYNFSGLVPSVFPNNLDITHTANVGVSAKIKQVELSAGLNWHTGKPYTLPEGVVDNEIVYGAPNSTHLPDYLRIDFSARYSFNISHRVKGQVGGSLWNLSNHQNIFNIYYQLDEQGAIQEVQQFALGITPNLMFRISF